MRKLLISVTAVLTLSAIAPVYAANSYQEVVEDHAAGLRANEKVEDRSDSITSNITNSFQDVVEKNRSAIQSSEKYEERMSAVTSVAPLSIQDAVFGDLS